MYVHIVLHVHGHHVHVHVQYNSGTACTSSVHDVPYFMYIPYMYKYCMYNVMMYYRNTGTYVRTVHVHVHVAATVCS